MEVFSEKDVELVHQQDFLTCFLRVTWATPDALKPRSARLQQCMNNLASWPLDANKLFGLLRVFWYSRSLYWMDLSACAPSSSAMTFFAFANSRTHAFFELPLRLAKHFLRDLVHSVGHFSSVRIPLLALYVTKPSIFSNRDACRTIRLFAFSPDGLQPRSHACGRG